jgi:hypothetical protein
VPYLFPHEDLFIVGVSALIAGLLVLRIRLIRRRRGHPEIAGPPVSRESADQQARSFDL